VSVEPIVIPKKIVSLIVVLPLDHARWSDGEMCRTGQVFGTLFRHARRTTSLESAVRAISVAVIGTALLRALVPTASFAQIRYAAPLGARPRAVALPTIASGTEMKELTTFGPVADRHPQCVHFLCAELDAEVHS
jgi:hypothetical protein